MLFKNKLKKLDERLNKIESREESTHVCCVCKTIFYQPYTTEPDYCPKHRYIARLKRRIVDFIDTNPDQAENLIEVIKFFDKT